MANKQVLNRHKRTPAPLPWPPSPRAIYLGSVKGCRKNTHLLVSPWKGLNYIYTHTHTHTHTHLTIYIYIYTLNYTILNLYLYIYLTIYIYTQHRCCLRVQLLIGVHQVTDWNPFFGDTDRSWHMLKQAELLKTKTVALTITKVWETTRNLGQADWWVHLETTLSRLGEMTV